jgi:DNA-directed RNA polymerase specialized sigma24 family protein
VVHKRETSLNSRKIAGQPPRVERIAECRLDFEVPLCLGRSVDSDDDVASSTAPGEDGQNRAAAFATTHWSLVLEAQSESPAAREALEKICRTYWRPIYSFLRRQGHAPAEAEDLTQGFFALILERRDLDSVRKEKGRLRSYLLASLKHFTADRRRRELAFKRGRRHGPVPLEELRANERVDLAFARPVETLTADQLYERRWALALMEQVLGRLKDEYRATGNGVLFDWLKQLLPDEPGAPSRAKIAAKLGMTDNALRQAFRRFRHRYQILLREEIGHTVLTASEIEDELRHLIAVLRK